MFVGISVFMVCLLIPMAFMILYGRLYVYGGMKSYKIESMEIYGPLLIMFY
jgi:hypothetical protein